jgi:hypothetical protein
MSDTNKTYDNTNKGGVWKGTTKDGSTYYSVKVNFEGRDIKVNIYRNAQKQEGDSRPVYNITIDTGVTPPASSTPATRQPKVAEDELPF